MLNKKIILEDVMLEWCNTGVVSHMVNPKKWLTLFPKSCTAESFLVEITITSIDYPVCLLYTSSVNISRANKNVIY